MARRRSRASKTASSVSRRAAAPRRSGGSGTRWLVALAVIVIATLGLCRKGWMVDPAERLAAASSDGVISQLLTDAATGRKVVQASAVIDTPSDRVWAVITDYKHYSEIFPEMKNATVERTSDGRRRLSAQVDLSPLPIKWKFSMKINHEKKDKMRLAEWDESTATKTDKGFWRLDDLGNGHTRVTHRIDTSVSPFPGFILRTAIRSKMGAVFGHLRARLEETSKKS